MFTPPEAPDRKPSWRKVQCGNLGARLHSQGAAVSCPELKSLADRFLIDEAMLLAVAWNSTNNVKVADMFFHVPQRGSGFSPIPGAKTSEYGLSWFRLLIGMVLFIGLIFGAFFAQRYGWNEGSTTLSHMAGLIFGLITGAIFGEKSALSHERRS